MSFENPQIPEGINTSKEHPLREFIWLLAGVVVLVVLVVTLLGWFGSSLARLVPFETELKITRQFDPPEVVDDKLHRYLNYMRDRITTAMELDDEYRILLRYQKDNTVNAFATLGGNVILYRGLLKDIPHENALAMLMAHEIAHVQHRDPIVGLGRGVFVQLGLSALMGNTPTVESIFGQAGLLHAMRYSRDMEHAADEAALKVLVKLYGHADGSTDLFKLLGRLRKKADVRESPEFFSTHPLDEHRIQRLEKLADDNGWSRNGGTTPLPSYFRQSLGTVD